MVKRRRKITNFIVNIDSSESRDAKGAKQQAPRAPNKSEGQESAEGDAPNEPQDASTREVAHPLKQHSPRKGERAHYPSKVKIEYPKVKLRAQPPPEPSQLKPEVTVNAMRGKDVLLISLCKKPETCVLDPTKIDMGPTPFQTVINLPEMEALEAEIEAAQASSRIHRKPLHCFSPARWALLPDEREQRATTSTDATSHVTVGKGPEAAERGKGQKAPTYTDATVAPQKGSFSPAAANAVGGAVSFFQGHLSDPSSSSRDAEDERARKLIRKYTPGEPWPTGVPDVVEENRATYELLRKQLQDANRLMDAPVRKRGNRLWKSPAQQSHRHKSNRLSAMASALVSAAASARVSAAASAVTAEVGGAAATGEQTPKTLSSADENPQKEELQPDAGVLVPQEGEIGQDLAEAEGGPDGTLGDGGNDGDGE